MVPGGRSGVCHGRESMKVGWPPAGGVEGADGGGGADGEGSADGEDGFGETATGRAATGLVKGVGKVCPDPPSGAATPWSGSVDSSASRGSSSGPAGSAGGTGTGDPAGGGGGTAASDC